MDNTDSFIQVKKLSKRYSKKEDKFALNNVSFSVDRGEIFGIIGLSGAGKSTLMRCLAKLEAPSSGHILIGDKNLTELNRNETQEYFKQIGMIFQNFNLLSSRTVEENVAFPLELDKVSKVNITDRVQYLLEIVGLSHKKDVYPSSLSGGEKQRVAIARALARNPKLLFCDEATSALDPKTTKDILLLLKKLNQEFNLTIVLITHQMEVIKEICNHVIVLEKGQVVESGKVEEIFSDPKHPTTKNFLQKSSHDMPPFLIKKNTSERKTLRLYFKGESAQKPLITHLIRQFDVDANILGGWIDWLQSSTFGCLTIELKGKSENLEKSLQFLKENNVHIEEEFIP